MRRRRHRLRLHGDALKIGSGTTVRVRFLNADATENGVLLAALP